MTTSMEVNDVYFEVEYSYYEAPSGKAYAEVDDILIGDVSVLEVLSDFVIQKIEQNLDNSIADDDWNANEDKADARRKYDE